jgi:hypothetical protein
MVELRPISAHEVAAEIALYWRGCCELVAKFDVTSLASLPG